MNRVPRHLASEQRNLSTNGNRRCCPDTVGKGQAPPSLSMGVIACDVIHHGIHPGGIRDALIQILTLPTCNLKASRASFRASLRVFQSVFSSLLEGACLLEGEEICPEARDHQSRPTAQPFGGHRSHCGILWAPEAEDHLGLPGVLEVLQPAAFSQKKTQRKKIFQKRKIEA